MYNFLKFLNNLILFFSALVWLFLFQSCDESLNIEIPKSAPMLTVNCILNAGDSILAEINSSQPYPPLIDSSLTIKNASVKLFEDDVYVDDLIYQESYTYPFKFSNYQSLNGFIPGLNHTYSINVSAPGFTEVASKTYIPQPVNIISIDTCTVFTKNGRYIFNTLECKIKFKDPPGIKNWYKLDIDRIGYRYYNGLHWQDGYTLIVKYGVPFFCYDLNAVSFRRSPYTVGSFGRAPIPDGIEIPLLHEMFLADDTFDGETYTLTVLILLLLNDDAINPEPPHVKFTLRKLNFRLYSINEEYYKYASSYFTQIYKKNDMFSEPRHVYSNIGNGVGIFSGSSSTVDSSIVMPVYYTVIMKK